jgi:hypothetical protein
MNSFNQKDLLLIIDSQTRAIACTAPTLTTAKSVILSSIKTELISIPIRYHWISEEFKTTDFNDINISVRLSNVDKSTSTTLNVLNFKPENMQSWKDERNKIKIRVDYLDNLDRWCQRMMTPTIENTYFDHYLSSFMYEVSQCNPKEGYYTPSIESFAKISKCNVENAYQEIKMHIDNSNHVRLRNTAVYIKYRNMMNNTEATREAQRKVLEMAQNELYRNSFV